MENVRLPKYIKLTLKPKTDVTALTINKKIAEFGWDIYNVNYNIICN